MGQCASHCCRKGDSFRGPRVGSCLTLGNELSEETHVLTKQETLLGRGALGGEQQGKGTQENCSAMWLAVSCFMVMGLVSGLFLASHSDSVPYANLHLVSFDFCCGKAPGCTWECRDAPVVIHYSVYLVALIFITSRIV